MSVAINGAGSITGIDQGFNVTAGSVGVGTTNPRTDLQVGAFGGGDSNIQLATGTSGASNILFGDGSGGSDYYKGFIKYNHSTDNLELYTTDDLIHYTGGSESLRIQSNGEVKQQSTGGSTIYELKRSDANTTGAVGTINFTASDGHSVASMSAMGDGDNEGAHIVFRTTSAAANNSPYNAATAERLRIDSSGRVLIGRTSVLASSAERLTIDSGMVMFRRNSANAAALYIRNEDTTADTRQPYLIFTDGGGNRGGFGVQYNESSLWISGQNGISFRTSGSAPSTNERLRITSAGLVGINCTPLAQLQVKAGTNANIALTTMSSEAAIEAFNDAGSANVPLRLRASEHKFFIGSTERLRITDTGMVGINMTPSTTGSSTYMLQMYNAGSQCFMSLGQGTGNGPLRGLVMGVSNAAHYITGRENRPTIFATNDTERLRITNDGKFGFGTSSPSSLLHGEVSSGSAILTLKSTATSGEASVSISGKNSSGTARTGIFKYDNGDMIRLGTAQAIPMRFETSDLERMRISSAGQVTMPYQPCAMAYNAQGQHMAGGAVAQFNNTRFNIGNMYNSSNGRMTVPVAGRYLVAYSGLHDYVSQSSIGFDVRINGSKFDGGEGYQARNGTPLDHSQLSKTLILSLSANDYVEIYIRQSGTQVHQRYGSFSMCLIT